MEKHRCLNSCGYLVERCNKTGEEIRVIAKEYTPDLKSEEGLEIFKDVVLARVSEGESLTTICTGTHGYPPQNIWRRMMQEDRNLEERFKDANKARAQVVYEKAINIMATSDDGLSSEAKNQVNQLLEAAARADPNRYGKKSGDEDELDRPVMFFFQHSDTFAYLSPEFAGKTVDEFKGGIRFAVPSREEVLKKYQMTEKDVSERLMTVTNKSQTELAKEGSRASKEDLEDIERELEEQVNGPSIK